MSIFSMVFRLLIGLGLGIFFYAGLWFTVKRLYSSHHPALLALGSFWARTLVVLAGFLFIIENRWQYALVVFVGFIAGRLATSQFLAMPRVAAK